MIDIPCIPCYAIATKGRKAAELLNRGTQPLMIVGHRPFMDRFAGLLLAGDLNRTVVQFQQGGIVCLEREPKLRAWAVTPDLIA